MLIGIINVGQTTQMCIEKTTIIFHKAE